MPKKTKYPSTPAIDNLSASRQWKMQLRANLAGMCGICLKNKLSENYPKSRRCDECRGKMMNRVREKTGCKNPQPYRLRPRCDEILNEVKNTPISTFQNKEELEEMAKRLGCPVVFLNYLRRQKLGVKLKRGRPKK